MSMSETVRKLRELKLGAMADSYEDQMRIEIIKI